MRSRSWAPAAVNIIFRRQIAEAEDPDARREELIASYEEQFNNPMVAAEMGYIDDVIDPRETRPISSKPSRWSRPSAPSARPASTETSRFEGRTGPDAR